MAQRGVHVRAEHPQAEAEIGSSAPALAPPAGLGIILQRRDTMAMTPIISREPGTYLSVTDEHKFIGIHTSDDPPIGPMLSIHVSDSDAGDYATIHLGITAARAISAHIAQWLDDYEG